MSTAGIYTITNVVTGLVYVGCSINTPRRRHNHFDTLRRAKHRNRHLQEDFARYGEAAFLFEVISDRLDPADLGAYEAFWIDVFGSLERDRGYNIASSQGMSAEHCRAISQGRKGMKFSQAHCEAIRKAKTGARYSERSEESKKRSVVAISRWHAEAGHTQEARKKIASSVRRHMHENPVNKWGVTGLTFLPKHKNPWTLRLRINGKMKWLGAYPTREAAAEASRQAQLAILKEAA